VHARSHADAGHTAAEQRPGRERVARPGAEPGIGVAALLAAVRSVDGVRDAEVRTAADGDRTLRLDLDEGADARAVAAEVAKVLDDRLGMLVDPERATVVAEPGSGSLAVPLGAPARRVLVGRVQVVTGGLDATAEVALRSGDRTVTGTATGPAVESAILRTVATATLNAVDALLGGRARCGLDSAEITDVGADRLAVAVITLLTPAYTDRLPGVALVRGDARQAMARAVLGALNRRLDGFFSDGDPELDHAENPSSGHNREREER
jgi:hypothetical protein